MQEQKQVAGMAAGSSAAVVQVAGMAAGSSAAVVKVARMVAGLQEAERLLAVVLKKEVERTVASSLQELEAELHASAHAFASAQALTSTQAQSSVSSVS